MPHMSPENHLNRIQKFYSFLGEITDTQILGQNNEILGFQSQAVKMLDFLKRFKKHIDQMEIDFEQAIWSNQQMNSLLITYEKNLVHSYGDDVNRSKTIMVGTTIMANTEPDTDN